MIKNYLKKSQKKFPAQSEKWPRSNEEMIKVSRLRWQRMSPRLWEVMILKKKWTFFQPKKRVQTKILADYKINELVKTKAIKFLFNQFWTIFWFYLLLFEFYFHKLELRANFIKEFILLLILSNLFFSVWFCCILQDCISNRPFFLIIDFFFGILEMNKKLYVSWFAKL